MRTGIVTTTLLVGFLISAPPASTAVPSVDSATDQYVEYIPEVVGREDGRGRNEGRGPGSVPEKQIQRLEQQGSAGAAAAALAELTAPPAYPNAAAKDKDGSGSDGASQKPDNRSSSTRLDQGTETSGVSAVLSNVGGAGMGILLPVLMLLSVVGVVWLRIAGGRRDPGTGD